MKKIWGVAVMMLVLGGLVGYGISAYQTTTNVQEAYADGMAYQASITPTTTVGIPADLSCTFGTDSFNHQATVIADGSVVADVTVTQTLTVENNDDTATAKDVYIMLWNPATDKEGIDSELEVKETYVYLSIGGLQKAIYNDGYTDGYFVGDLAPGDILTITVGITLQDADADTYVDAQTYDCSIYVVQSTINYADAVDFTVLT